MEDPVEAAGDVSHEKREEYRRDGFVVIDSLIPPDFAVALNARLERVLL